MTGRGGWFRQVAAVAWVVLVAATVVVVPPEAAQAMTCGDSTGPGYSC